MGPLDFRNSDIQVKSKSYTWVFCCRSTIPCVREGKTSRVQTCTICDKQYDRDGNPVKFTGSTVAGLWLKPYDKE